MIGLVHKFVYGTLVFLLLFVISSEAYAYETDAVQFNATLGFGEYGFDSGYIGLDDPLARMLVHAYGTLGLNLADVTMNGSVWTDSGLIGIDGTSNGGNFSFSLGLEYGAYAYYGIPVLGLDYEIDLLALLGVPSMDLLLEDSQTFTPFLLDSSIQISDSLPPQKFGDFDVTNILFPGVPFVGAGVTLDADMELQENLSGERVYFSNPGSSIYSESSTLSFSGSSTILSYYEDADAEVIVGLWPGLYVDAFGWRFDFPIARIPVIIYSSDLPLPFNNSTVNFSSTTTSLDISATLSPSSNVPPYSSVNVTGTVTYNTGENVPVGIVDIDTGENVYTAAINNGTFSRYITAPSSSRNVAITAHDDTYGLQATIYRYISIKDPESGDGYTLHRTTMCRDVQSSSPSDPIDETECFQRSDAKATLWVHLTYLYVPVRIKVKWYDPSGNLYWDSPPSDWSDDPGPGAYYEWWKFWKYIWIDGHTAAYRPGKWYAKLYIDHGAGWKYRKTHYFTIAYELTEHRMAQDVQSSDPYMPIGKTDVFYQTDEKALTWANFDNVAESLDIKWDWYEPAGSLYFTYPYTSDDPGSGNCHAWLRAWGWINISGDSAANKCGNWTVDVNVKDAGGTYEKIYTDYFQILENPSVNPNLTVSANPGVPIETQSITLNLTATDNTYLDIVELHWKVDGIEQTPEISSNINSGSKNISRNIGSFTSGQQIEYWGVAVDTSGNRRDGDHHTIIIIPEVVTIPSRPTGESYLQVGQTGTYTTGGSATSLGHSVQYEFDWGDSVSGYGSATQGKTWSSEGYYFVRAHARCQTHTNRESDWSTPISVVVESTNPTVEIITNGGTDFETDQLQVVISGTATDSGVTSGLVSVSINTSDTNEGTLSDWQFTVDLSLGSNPITITAADNCSNTGQDTINITYNLPVYPEINVKQGGTDIPDDIGNYDFGDVDMGSGNPVIFTIENLGDANLDLTGATIVDIGGTHASDFVVTQQPSTPVIPASQETFEITFSPSGEGLRSAEVSILNNDLDENPYNFSITGTGTPQAYTITASAGPNGTIVPSGDVDVGPGENQLFTAYPSLGYTVDEWLLDGEPNQIGGTTYTLYNVQAPHTVEVTFKPIPSIVYVDDDATAGANNGSSWDDAFVYLQDALSLAANSGGIVTEVRVAQGTYTPDANSDYPHGTGDRTASFQLVNGVALKGGYFGIGAADPNERDIGQYETILSGDLNGDDGPDFANNGENSYHVVTGSGTNETAFIEGLSIIAGKTTNGSPPWNVGAGMYNSVGSPVISYCTFYGNSSRGGTLYNVQCPIGPKVSNCVFRDNEAIVGGTGVYNAYSNATLTNCVFARNYSDYGGAIQAPDHPRGPTLTNCILWANANQSGMNEAAQIQGGVIVVNYSCIFGWSAGLGGSGNFGADPFFADPKNGDYHLSPGSPCIDAGDSDSVPAEVTTDLDGKARFIDDILTPDTGVGTPPIVDMGAYEFGALYVYADSLVDPELGTPTNPFRQIQDAIDAATGHYPIRVAAGTYEECITVKDGISLYGGYDGEDWYIPRDPNFNETIIDANSLDTVITVVDANTIIDGFTITRGLADIGGGIYCENSSLTMSNCVITSNSTIPGIDGVYDDIGTNGGNSGNGGGIYCVSSDMEIQDCLLSQNRTGNGGNGGNGEYEGGDAGNSGNGGGVYCSVSTVQIKNTIFEENNSTGDGGSGGTGSTEWGGDGGDSGNGGAVCSFNSTLTISSCSIENNQTGNGGARGHMYSALGGHAGSGGGIYSNGIGDLLISDCLISENITGQGGFGGYDMSSGDSGNGGGIYCTQLNSLFLNKCDIRNNKATDGKDGDSGGDGGSGGGIYCSSINLVTIESSIFSENEAGDNGRGYYVADGDCGDGGAIYSDSPLIITACEFYDNLSGDYSDTGGFYGSCGHGGGIYCTQSLNISDSAFMNNKAGSSFVGYIAGDGGGLFCGSNVSVNNCLFTRNDAGDSYGGYDGWGGNGGGIYSNGACLASNCTFFSNSAGLGSGTYGEDGLGGGVYSSSDAGITNGIFWGNKASGVANESAQIYGGIPNPNYSCIQGLTGALGGDGNIGDNPLFADPNNGDYNLLPASPCIDAGKPGDDCTNEPLPNGGIINMGAYGNTSEATVSYIYFTDTDGDGLLDYLEIDWGLSPDSSDTDGDGLTDFYEACYNYDCNDYDPYPAGGDLDAISVDTDQDGMSDNWEVDYGDCVDPLADNDADLDCDNDGYTNLEEFMRDTLPNDSNSFPVSITLYVDNDAPNDPDPNNPDISDLLEDGSAEHPFDAIQKAINVAIDGDTVIVLDGIYTGTGNRDIDFNGKAITVRSDNGPDACIIDCQINVTDCYGGGCDPHRGFYFHSGEDINSALAGFAITNGYAEKGGGIYCENSSPKITNCTIRNNHCRPGLNGGYGGGMYNFNSDPVLENCIFERNEIDGAALNHIRGGGMYNLDSSPSLSNCIFTRNGHSYHWLNGGAMLNNNSHPYLNKCIFEYNGAGYEGFGGAICNSSSNPVIVECTFYHNYAYNGGGAICSDVWGGGDSNLTILHCTFQQNNTSRDSSRSPKGGAIFGGVGIIDKCLITHNYAYCGGGGIAHFHGEIRNCQVTNNTGGFAEYPQGYRGGGGLLNCDGIITNCIISNNSFNYDGAGGGLAGCDGLISNCTIIQNEVPGYEYNDTGLGGGLYNCTGQIENCIIWGNTAEIDGDQLYSSSDPNYSCIQGWTGGGVGNITSDPLFADPNGPDGNPATWEDNDFHLKSQYGRWDLTSHSWVYDSVNSPCIDTGHPGSDWTGELWPHGKRINMGAYGGTPQASMSSSTLGIVADINNDGIVNWLDFALLSAEWEAGQARTIPVGDITVDGDLSDWTGHVEWIALDKIYYGEPNDVTDAKFALRWNPDANSVYVVVMVEDTDHVFRDDWGTWDASDRLEVCSQGDSEGGSGWQGDYDVAQKYTIVPDTSGGAFATWGNGDTANLEATEIEYAVSVNGDLIIYEVGVKQFDNYGGVTGGQTVVTDLSVGHVLGFDLLLDTRRSGGFGMLSENMMPVKHNNADSFARYILSQKILDPPYEPLIGDVDRNGVVDFRDLVFLCSNWCQDEDQEQELLVAHWKLDETDGIVAQDASINNNHGTLVNGPAWTGTGELSLDGTNDYVDCGNDQSLDLTGNLSIGLWFYARDWTNNSYPTLISKRNSWSSMDWQLFYYGSFQDIQFWYGNAGAGMLFDDLNVNPSTEMWHFIVVTRDGNTWTLYLDGAPEGTNIESAPMSAGETVRIGSLEGTHGYFDGMIDEIRIYDRALTEGEVQGLYENY